MESYSSPQSLCLSMKYKIYLYHTNVIIHIKYYIFCITSNRCCCCCCCVASVMSDSVQPHRWQPTRLRHPWDSPGKNTGVDCHCLLPWLYRASPSLAAKNQSDFGIDHLVMSTCRVDSCIVGRGCLLWPVHSLDKILQAFVLLHTCFMVDTS